MLENRTSMSDSFVYSSKAAVSAVVAYLAFGLFHLPGAIWALVSAVVCRHAAEIASVVSRLRWLRVAANLIGAGIGAVASALLGHTLLSLGAGIFLTGVVCFFSRLEDAIRPAFAAVVIVALSSEPSVWAGSLDRVTGVMTGCVAALVVGAAFDRVSSLFQAHPEGDAASKQKAEEG